jgi:hypothetical protein
METREMSAELVKEKYEDQLMSLPNVTGVGIGERGGREVIKVFVTRKVPRTSLSKEDVVPQTLEGCEVAVEEIGTITAQQPG